MSNDKSWSTIWRNKNSTINFNELDDKQLLLELKGLNGFDIVDGALDYESFLQQYKMIVDKITKYELITQRKTTSICEIGCGSGANLYLFSKDDYKVGGVDYSPSLLTIASEVLPVDSELINSEANNFNLQQKYDVILSNSVFSYFDNEQYADVVLTKMVSAMNDMLILIDIHDKDKKEAYLTYRRALIENYDEKYDGLDKLFYTKQFFVNFARKHNLIIEFFEETIEGYWNNDFVYNCCMYKK